MYDDLIIEAQRADVHRALDKIYYARECLAIINKGRPAPAKMSWFSRIFGGGPRVQTPVEVLEPVAVRLRSNR